MKNSYLLPLILFLIIVSCQPKEKEVVTSVSGTITNPAGEIVTFRLSDTTITDTLDVENRFSAVLPIEKPTDVRFGHGEEIAMIYLRPGDSLYLTLDPEQFDESLVFTGTASDINNYKAAIVLLQDSLIGMREVYILPEALFLKTLDSISELKLSFMDKMSLKDEVYKSMMRNNAKWELASNKLRYESYHAYYAKLDSFSVSDEFYTFQESLDISDSLNLEYPAFKGYVEMLVGNTAQEIFEDDGIDEFWSIYLDVLDEMVTIPSLKADLSAQVIEMAYLSLDEDTRAKTLSYFESSNTDPELAKEITELMTKLDKVTQGKPAPDFSYASIEGDTLSMGDFLGQVVYIDVWATWCGPCIAEHPYMEKLQEEFADEPVAFLAISTDSSPEPWKKMVKARDLGGIHLYAPGAWGASIMEDYAIIGIPRFILIDQKGMIVSADAARPSGDIAEKISKLLKTS